MTEIYEDLRPLLFSIAYRMLGSASEAEDIVQDAFLRFHQAAKEEQIDNPKAYLSTITTRLSIDHLRSARVKRESYTGTWLPEPVVTDAPVDRESISIAFLVLLERLSPVERAAFLMHKVFDYAHAEIAAALDMSEAAVRQAYHRANGHLEANRPRFAPSEAEHARMLSAFSGALRAGDLSSLLGLLAEDAALYADSGGKVRGAARRPVLGADRVARFLVGLLEHALVEPGISYAVQSINGWPAFIIRRADGSVFAIVNIETDGEKIVAIRNLVNPDKLRLPTVN